MPFSPTTSDHGRPSWTGMSWGGLPGRPARYMGAGCAISRKILYTAFPQWLHGEPIMRGSEHYRGDIAAIARPVLQQPQAHEAICCGAIAAYNYVYGRQARSAWTADSAGTAGDDRRPARGSGIHARGLGDASSRRSGCDAPHGIDRADASLHGDRFHPSRR